MPGNILTTQAKAPIKMLLIGDSGAGKTGAIFALAKAGYKVLYADFDNGLDVIRALARDDAKAAENIYYQGFYEKWGAGPGGAQPIGIPDAFTKFVAWMEKATIVDGSGTIQELGNVGKLGNEWVFVLDSLTHCANAAFRWVRALNGHLLTAASQPDWGNAQDRVENLIAMLTAETCSANVIVNAHVDYITLEGSGLLKGLPTTLGKALSPKVPSYFNTIVIAKSMGSGKDNRRVLKTVSEGIIEAKFPVPGKLREDLPIDSGLGTIFATLKGTA